MLVLHLRTARRRARAAATAEALALLHDLDPTAPLGGPLSEQGGIVWVGLPRRHVKAARGRLPRLGYTTAVDLLVADDDTADGSDLPVVRWRRRDWRLVRLYQEDPAALRERAPDRREFLFETARGEVRAVRGYRGSPQPLAHRALPVPDARLLVNLVAPAGPGMLLDPFAGAGGIAVEAREAGWTTVTVDIDPAVRYGLAALSRRHLVADARALPLRAGSVQAVATEPPYDRSAGPVVIDSLGEIARVLCPGGRVAVLAAHWQAPMLREASDRLALQPALDAAIDRKGTDVVALAWAKPPLGVPVCRGGSVAGRED